MPVTQLTSEPLKLTAGDSISFTKSFSAYPASQGWALKYELRGGAQPIEWVSTAQADAHVIAVAAAVTAAYLPGTYDFTGFAVNDGTGDRQQIYFNFLPVYANAQAQPGDADTRTFAQKMLAQWESILAGTCSHDILNSSVNGTQIGRMTPEEKHKAYDYWRAKVNNELHAATVSAGGQSQRTVKFIFSRVK